MFLGEGGGGGRGGGGGEGERRGEGERGRGRTVSRPREMVPMNLQTVAVVRDIFFVSLVSFCWVVVAR